MPSLLFAFVVVPIVVVAVASCRRRLLLCFLSLFFCCSWPHKQKQKRRSDSSQRVRNIRAQTQIPTNVGRKLLRAHRPCTADSVDCWVAMDWKGLSESEREIEIARQLALVKMLAMARWCRWSEQPWQKLSVGRTDSFNCLECLQISYGKLL